MRGRQAVKKVSIVEEKPLPIEAPVLLHTTEGIAKRDTTNEAGEKEFPPLPSELLTTTPATLALNLSISRGIQKSPRKVARNSCRVCKKRLGPALSFDCRCGSLFCGAHRYSDKHGCLFDYQAQAQAQYQRENPKVNGQKLATC
jgi:hypothetical protein